MLYKVVKAFHIFLNFHLVTMEEVLEILEVRVEVDKVDDESDEDAKEEDDQHGELLLGKFLVLQILLS